MLETKEKYDKRSLESSEKITPANAANASATPAPEDEIDLADLFRQIWARRRIVLITTMITFVIGIFVAIFSPEEYEASIVLMPQNTTSSGGGPASGLLRQFGGLAGINLGDGGGNGSLGPYLYPEITQSTPFYLQMMEEDMYFTTLDTTASLLEYFGGMEEKTPLDYVKTYIIGLPKLILNIPVSLINSFKSKPGQSNSSQMQDTTQANITVASDSIHEKSINDQKPIKLTGQQLSVISALKGRIKTTIEKNGTVKVSAVMPDPLVAANTTEMAVKYLTNYIQEYRTEKTQQNLVFIQKQYDEKEEKYNIAQQRLARFQDQNTNIFTESARIELERLRTENNLAFSLYQSLAQQLEQAKIRLQEDIPVFKVLEPIQIPSRISTPKREMIIIVAIFAGIFLGISLVFMNVLYSNFKSKLF